VTASSARRKRSHPEVEQIDNSAASSLSAGAARPVRVVSPSLAAAVDDVLQVGGAPLRAAFLVRALHVLARITPHLDDRALGNAVGAASDYGVLVSALQEPAALQTLVDPDPLAASRLRGMSAREEILRAEGGTLTAQQVAAHLRLTRQAVDKRRRAGRLLALAAGRRGYLYPAWQFGPDGMVRGFEDALGDLTVADPWARAAFFLSGEPRLDGMTPLNALRSGDTTGVRRAARGHGEHSAA
jgi:hypothetical protein